MAKKRVTKEKSIPKVFAAPWKNSGIILEAGSVEFHVHRAILGLHSWSLAQ